MKQNSTNSIDHCRKRLQWRCRHSSRFENNDDEWCFCHECDYGTDGTKHNRRPCNSGIYSDFLKQQLDAVFEDFILMLSRSAW